MHKKKLFTRVVSGAVVVAVTGGSALLVNGVAGAAPPPGTVGSLTITPAEGDDNARMSAQTSGPCPSNAKLADLIIEGPVGPDGTTAPDTATFPSSNPYPVTSVDSIQFSTTTPFVQQFNKTIKDAATERGKAIQVGEYHLTTRCWDEFTIEVLGTFTGGLTFDTPTHYTVIPTTSPTPTPTPVVTPSPTPVVTPSPTPVVTPSPTPGAQATTTRLSATPIPLPFIGGILILQAQVAPANATGTVQFKDGTTVIGSAPAFFGNAGPTVVILPRGSHSITATFVPNNPAAFQPSTSAPPVTVTF